MSLQEFISGWKKKQQHKKEEREKIDEGLKNIKGDD